MELLRVDGFFHHRPDAAQWVRVHHKASFSGGSLQAGCCQKLSHAKADLSRERRR